MNRLVKSIPNALTSLNLLCGFAAIVFSFNPQTLVYAPVLIFVATIFDFADGFAARLLKAYSEIGKQLDSLADVVSFGVAPGVLVYHLMLMSENTFGLSTQGVTAAAIIFGGLIPIFSALRLAKFNIDTRQTSSFIGLPTPASAILIASLAFVVFTNSTAGFQRILLLPAFIALLSVCDCVLMVLEMPMFSLKIASLSLHKNKVLYTFLAGALLLLLLFKMAALPLIVVLYVLVSLTMWIFGSK